MFCYSQLVLRHITIAVLLVAAVSPRSFAEGKQTVRLRTTDAVTITGTYYPAKQTNAPAVLLIHSVARNRGIWTDFATLLQQNGIAALAIDLRGHGESTRKITADGPVTLDFHNATPADYQDMLLDIEVAVDWLQAQPEIDKKRIGIVGESLGANIVLRYAAINEDLAAVVVFSPGLNYRNVRTDDVIAQVGRTPLRIFVSQFDSFAFESCKRLVEIQKEAGIPVANNELTVCTGNIHGADMLIRVRNLPQIVMFWLKAIFTKTSVPVAPTSPAPAPSDATPLAK
jgi:dienelactone hydrolase